MVVWALDEVWGPLLTLDKALNFSGPQMPLFGGRWRELYLSSWWSCLSLS